MNECYNVTVIYKYGNGNFRIVSVTFLYGLVHVPSENHTKISNLIDVAFDGVHSFCCLTYNN